MQSIQQNLPKVFGIKNDFFATMLFSYISGRAPLTHKINFHQFLAKLDVFWKKKSIKLPEEDRAGKEWRKRNAKMARRTAMKKFMYDFIRMSGSEIITILDLVKLCCYFKGDGVTDEEDDTMREIGKYASVAIIPNISISSIEKHTKKMLPKKSDEPPLGSCPFGFEVEDLMLKYKEMNIKPKYVHARREFGFNQYLKFLNNPKVPQGSCLI